MDVSKLEGAELDLAVARALGRTIRHDPMGFGDCSEGGWWIWEEVPSGRGGTLINKAVYQKVGREYSPSTNWAQGGPLIDLAGIELLCNHPALPQHKDPAWHTASWRACYWGRKAHHFYGPTALIAAMRCLVAYHQGIPTL